APAGCRIIVGAAPGPAVIARPGIGPGSGRSADNAVAPVTIDIGRNRGAISPGIVIAWIITCPGAPPRIVPGIIPAPAEGQRPARGRAPGERGAIAIGGRAAIPGVAHPGITA